MGRSGGIVAASSVPGTPDPNRVAKMKQMRTKSRRQEKEKRK